MPFPVYFSWIILWLRTSLSSFLELELSSIFSHNLLDIIFPVLSFMWTVINISIWSFTFTPHVLLFSLAKNIATVLFPILFKSTASDHQQTFISLMCRRFVYFFSFYGCQLQCIVFQCRCLSFGFLHWGRFSLWYKKLTKSASAYYYYPYHMHNVIHSILRRVLKTKVSRNVQLGL